MSVLNRITKNLPFSSSYVQPSLLCDILPLGLKDVIDVIITRRRTDGHYILAVNFYHVHDRSCSTMFYDIDEKERLCEIDDICIHKFCHDEKTGQLFAFDFLSKRLWNVETATCVSGIKVVDDECKVFWGCRASKKYSKSIQCLVIKDTSIAFFWDSFLFPYVGDPDKVYIIDTEKREILGIIDSLLPFSCIKYCEEGNFIVCYSNTNVKVYDVSPFLDADKFEVRTIFCLNDVCMYTNSN